MNTDDFILSTIRTALAVETTFKVVNTKGAEELSGDKILCYPYIALDELLNTLRYQDTTQSGKANAWVLEIGADFSFKAPMDDGSGVGAKKRNEIVAKCKKAIRTLNATLPLENNDTDYGYKCSLRECVVTAKGGYTDDGRTDVEVVVRLQVKYYEYEI